MADKKKPPAKKTPVKKKAPATKKAATKRASSTNTKKGRGRPEFKITPAVCNKAKALASQGLTREQIALSLGMGKSTFYEKLANYSDFSDAITQGTQIGIAAVTNALYVKCLTGDVPAIKTYLFNRDPDNWQDRRNVEHSGNIGMKHEDRLAHLR